MSALIPIMLASSHLVLAAAQVPQLNIDPGCHEAATAAISPGRNEDVCKRDENDARGKLEQEWAQFTRSQKTHCTTLSRLGGYPSYVELLTCLEIAKAADALDESDQPKDATKP
ncbi:MAG: hypothetical protein ACREB8_15260 [Pseudolabrys sp.]